jgi:hypothetical protein
MALKRPVFSRPSCRVENSVGRRERIVRASGGGRMMESTPWITPLDPNYVFVSICERERGGGTNNVDGDDLAVEVYVQTLEGTEAKAEPLWLSAELVFSQGSGNRVCNQDTSSRVEVRGDVVSQDFLDELL